MKRSLFTLILVLASQPSRASLEHLEPLALTARNLESTNTLSNPAGLGFESELNGNHLSSSFRYSFNRDDIDELSSSLGFGPIGLGYQRLSDQGQAINRFSLALGLPIVSTLFLGTRYRWNRSELLEWKDTHGWDLALQWRPLSFLALGAQANMINQSITPQLRHPTEYVVGLTLKPFSGLEIAFDLETNSSDFGRTIHYRGLLSWEASQGVSLQAGYHKQNQLMVGAQIQLNAFALNTTSHPNSNQHFMTSGVQYSGTPRSSALASSKTVSLNITDKLGEKVNVPSFFQPANPSLIELLTELKAIGESRAERVLITVSGFPLGLASAIEIGEAIQEIRRSGKDVWVCLSNAGIKEYLIAASANRILMDPVAELKLAGLRTQKYYLKGTLDKLGIEGELLAKGKFKSAPEIFTRNSASETSKETQLEKLKLADAIIKKQLHQWRKLETDTLNAAEKLAVLSAQTAKEMGLIDELQSSDTTLTKLKKQTTVVSSAKTSSVAIKLPDRISIVIAEGDILNEKVGILSAIGGTQITPDNFALQLAKATNDPRTKAIIVRVSSPGGDILASQRISDLVAETNQIIPIYISMGDVAASGGYLIALPGRRIFASPLTETGSIGVFLGKANLKSLYQKIGLNKQILSLSPHADLFSEHVPWTADSLKIMNRRLDEYYSHFLSSVSQYRKMNLPQTETVAQGRVWLGAQAFEKGLVDQMGGILPMIDFVAQTHQLSDYEIHPIPAPTNFFGSGLLGPLSLSSSENILPSEISAIWTGLYVSRKGNLNYRMDESIME